jgi:hypothetical protein
MVILRLCPEAGNLPEYSTGKFNNRGWMIRLEATMLLNFNRPEFPKNPAR